MIIYIKNGAIEKAVADEFDTDEGNSYDERIETSEFELSDNLEYIDGSISKIDIDEPDNILPIPEDS